MIHVLDELAVRPGHLQEVRDRVSEFYEPAVTPLGMRLANTWIAPAVELLDAPTELLLLWEIADRPTYWRMRSATSRDPVMLDFWRDLAPPAASTGAFSPSPPEPRHRPGLR